MGSLELGLNTPALHPSRTGFQESSLALEKQDHEPKGGAGWELVDRTSIRDPTHTPERGPPSVYLSCFDMLFTEDSGWTLKVPEGAHVTPMRLEQRKEPEQCPLIDSQGLCLSPEMDYQIEDRSLEQVQTMVVGEVLKDIEMACKLLNIPPDPMDWTPGNVQKWVLWTEHLYRLPQVGKSFQELSGKDLCAMTEEEFRHRSPLWGDVLYAHLDIWKSAAWMKERSSPEVSKFIGSDEVWSVTEADSSSSGQPIHLWQFLKELLLKPHKYGRCISWLNKEKGIFKIEDSAHVARLWGIRKNRPAMNYDKLSRSIRQYYKKGIIRKPDVSQRLVYQFVQPV